MKTTEKKVTCPKCHTSFNVSVKPAQRLHAPLLAFLGWLLAASAGVVLLVTVLSVLAK